MFGDVTEKDLEVQSERGLFCLLHSSLWVDGF